MQFRKLPGTWMFIYGLIVGSCAIFALSFAMFQEQVTDDYIYYALYFSEVQEQMRQHGVDSQAVDYMSRLSAGFCGAYEMMVKSVLLPGARDYSSICEVIRKRNVCRGIAFDEKDCESLESDIIKTGEMREEIMAGNTLPDYIFNESKIPFGNTTLFEWNVG